MNSRYKALFGTVVGIVLLSFAASVQAQYKATGDDGITASPRVRQHLDEYTRNHTAPVASADIKPMTCAKCTDTWVARPDNESRGLGARTQLTTGAPEKLVAKHLCEGCATKLAVTGHGRAKQSVAIHTCTGCGAESLACCKTTKSSDVVTKSREKKFEIAPLK